MRKTIDIPYRLCYYIEVREKTKQSAALTLARKDATWVYIAQYHRTVVSVGVMGVWASVHAFFLYEIIEGYEITVGLSKMYGGAQQLAI